MALVRRPSDLPRCGMRVLLILMALPKALTELHHSAHPTMTTVDLHVFDVFAVHFSFFRPTHAAASVAEILLYAANGGAPTPV